MPLTPEEIDAIPDEAEMQGPPAPGPEPSLPVRIGKGILRGAQALGLVQNANDDDVMAQQLADAQRGPLAPVQDHIGKVSRFWEQTPMIRAAKGGLEDVYETVTGNPTLRNTKEALLRDRGGKVLDYIQHGDTDIRTPYEKQMDAEGDVGIGRGIKDAVFNSPEMIAKLALASETGGASMGGQSLANALIFGTTKQGFDPKQGLVMGGMPQFGKYIAEPVSDSIIRSLADAGIVKTPALADLTKTALKTAIDTVYFESPNVPELVNMTPRERARHLAGSIGTMIAMNSPELARNGIDFVKDARLNSQLENIIAQEQSNFDPYNPDYGHTETGRGTITADTVNERRDDLTNLRMQAVWDDMSSHAFANTAETIRGKVERGEPLDWSEQQALNFYIKRNDPTGRLPKRNDLSLTGPSGTRNLDSGIEPVGNQQNVFQVIPEITPRPVPNGPMGNMATALGVGPRQLPVYNKPASVPSPDADVDAAVKAAQDRTTNFGNAQWEKFRSENEQPAAVPAEPTELATPPGERGRTLPSHPRSAFENTPPPSLRGRQLVSSPRSVFENTRVGAPGLEPAEPQAPGVSDDIGGLRARSAASRVSGFGRTAPVSAFEDTRVGAPGFPEGFFGRRLYPSANQLRQKLQERSRPQVKKKEEGIGNPLELATVDEAYKAANRLISSAGPRARSGQTYTPAWTKTDAESFRQVITFKKPAAILDEPTLSEEAKGNIAAEAQKRGLTAVKVFVPSTGKAYYIIGHKWAVDTLLNRYNKPRTVIDDVASGLALGYKPEDISAFVVRGDKGPLGKTHSRQITNLDGTPYEYGKWVSNPVKLRPTGETAPQPEPDVAPKVSTSEFENVPAPGSRRPNMFQEKTVTPTASTPAKSAAEATGWTVDPVAKFPGVNMGGLTPSEVEQMSKVMPKQYEFTDRRKGSPTEGLTTYVPESATTEEILNQIKAKAEEYVAAQKPKPAPAPEPKPPKLEPESDPRLDLANELIDDYELDSESTRAKGVSIAKKLHAQGLISDISLSEIVRIGKDKDMGPDDLVGEMRGSLITKKEAHDSPGTVTGAERVIESTGIEGLRDIINNPESDLSEDHRRVIRALLDTPALKDLFWDRLMFKLGTANENAAGNVHIGIDAVGRVAELAIAMRRDATPDTFPHEVFHVLYALAPEDAQETIRWYRQEFLHRDKEQLPQYSEVIDELLNRDISSKEFNDRNLPPELYDLINPSEFMAWFSGHRFSREALNPEAKTLISKIHDWVTGIIDWVRNAFGVPREPGLIDIYDAMLRGEYKNTPQGGINFEGSSLSKAIDSFKESDKPDTDPQTKEYATRFLKQEQAGDVMGQMELINRMADSINTELVTKNTRGNIVLKGDALNRYRTFEFISSLPPIKKYILASSENLKKSAALLNGAITKYQDIKNDTTNPPEMAGAAAKAAIEQLDGFYDALPQFQRDREAAINKTLADLESAFDDVTKAGKGTALQTLRNSLKETGATFADQTLARSILDKNSIAATNRALDWIAKNVSPANIKNSVNADEMFMAIDSEVTSKVTDDKTWEMNIGTTAEVVRRLARVIAESPKLKQDILDTQKFLSGDDTAADITGAKKEIEKLLTEGKYKEAIDVLTKGFGKDAAEREATRQFMEYHWKDIKKQLPKLEGYKMAGDMLGNVLADPTFRNTVEEVYKDAGVEKIIRNQGNEHLTLEPVYYKDEKGERIEPTELNIEPGSYGSADTLKKLSDYFDQATRYINDVDHPEYDPRKAAALKTFMSDKALWLDPSTSPLAPYFRKSWARKAIEKTVGFKWRAEMIPMYALDRHYGVAAEDANRSLQRLASAMEMRSTIAKDHLATKGGVWDSLSKALESHGFSVHEINNYQNSVWNALAGSLQEYGNLNQMKAGSKIGNGFEITPEDIELFKAVRAFEKDAYDTAEGTSKKRELSSIASDPESVLYKTDSGTMKRKHLDTGPGTMSRRYQMHVSAWDTEWRRDKTPEGRINFLDQNLNTVLFGYVADADNGAYVGKYAYRPEFKEILKEARDGEKIQSFEDLVERTYQKKLDSLEEEGEELPEGFSKEMVRDEILKELDDTFKRFRSTLPKDTPSLKSDLEFFGGDNSFNTERGQQIIPSMWYKYGSLTMGEAVSFLHQFSSKFMLEHYRGVSRLLTALNDLSTKYDDGRIKESDDYFYNAGEIKAAQKEIKDYLNKLKKVREESNELQIPDEFGNFTNPLINYHVASMLSKPKTLIINMMNGISNALSFEQAVMNHGLVSMAKGLLLKPVPAVAKESIHLLTHPGTFWGKEVRKVLEDSKNKPVVGKLAEIISNYINRSAEIYGKAADLGLNLNTNLLSTIHSESKFAGTGGYPVGGAPRGMFKNILSKSAYPFRVASQGIRHAFQGYVDSRINSMAVGMADNMEQDLMNRAEKYGETRVKRAVAENRDPYDITDLRNRFSDAELVRGRLGATDAASRLREFMRRYANVNLDHQMWDYYQRKQADPNAKLLTQAQKNQLILAVSQDVNQSTFATRPVIQRTNKLFNALGLFLGYPAYEMHHLSSYLDKQANTGYGKALLQNLPLMLAAAATATAAGTMAIGGSDLINRKLFKSIPLYPSILDARNTKERIKAALSGLSSILPYYGWIINMAMGRSYKYGLDANNLTVLLGYADQIQQATREMFATKESWKDPHWAMPLLRMESRSTFPLNYAAPHLPVMSGKYEITQVGNAIGSHARDIGLEERKGADGGFWPHHDKVILDKWDNAVGNGNMADARAAFHELIVSNRENKVLDPEGAARRTLSARNPITRKLAKKPTEEEWNKILADMPEEDRARVTGLLHNYNRALTLVGANEVAFKSAFDTGGGGGGGGLGGSGGAPSMGTVGSVGGGGGGEGSVGLSGGMPRSLGGGGNVVGSGIRGGGVPSVNSGLRRIAGRGSITRGIRLRTAGPTKRSGLRRLASGSRRASLNKLRSVVTIKRGIV